MGETTLLQRLGRVLSWVCYSLGGLAAVAGIAIIIATGFDDRAQLTLVRVVLPALAVLALGRGIRYVLSNE